MSGTVIAKVWLVATASASRRLTATAADAVGVSRATTVVVIGAAVGQGWQA